MEFVKKYSYGPWTVELNIDGVYAGKNNLVFNKTGFICECSRQHRKFENAKQTEYNAKLISIAPDMIDYLIKRAEYLCEITSIDDSDFNDATIENKKDLNRILKMIRSSGVEVKF